MARNKPSKPLPRNTPRRAVWTIVLSTLLAVLLPVVAILRYSDFNVANQLGGAIGGIAGPLLNFAGLLIVYFSLREQFRANQLQIRHFSKEQRRSAKENSISIAFKIVDDLRAESRRLLEHSTLSQANPSYFVRYIDTKKYSDFEEVNYLREPRILPYKVDFDEAAGAVGMPYDCRREIINYFQLIAAETRVFRATCGMLRFLLGNSPLPLTQRLHLYTITAAIVEPVITTLLNGLEIFRQQNAQVDDLVQEALELQQEISNSYEAIADLVVHGENLG